MHFYSSPDLKSPGCNLPSAPLPLFIFIMAGGSGERFWPASRTKMPKHLLKLLGKTTLLEQTVRRFEGIVPLEQIRILTNKAQRAATIAALPFFPEKNIIAEPAKRDTAPAAALATALALQEHPQALVALFPADAMIHDVVTFQTQLKEAALCASTSKALFTFSISPSYPSTGFGYLDLGKNLTTTKNDKTLFRCVTQFVEKPPLAQAEQYCQSGHHGWNAGMFLWQAQSFLAECEEQQPELARFIQELSRHDIPEKYLEDHFASLPKISIDYAIMEKASTVIAAVAQFDWDDVGSWTSLPKHIGSDIQKNTLQNSQSNIIMLDAKNNIIVSEGKTVALCGVSDLVVVQTADAILICHRNAVEDIKKLPVPEALK